ncbi:hypothetical protein ACFX5U_08495 [Sphingobacterium sp. SG20118]|uniref:hypothetical protein n=1 Tax=Sphingobacterium sp. SG20118 TaxID=3367156 RepID=UPI0037DFBFB0
MKYKLKNITPEVFFKSFQSYEKQMQKILQGEVDLEIRAYTNSTIEGVKRFLQRYIGLEGDELINWLNMDYPTVLDNFYSKYSGHHLPEIKKEIVRLERFYKSFSRLGKYLSIVDNIGDLMEKRDRMSVSDKKDFILNKLNSLHSDDFFSIESIFDVNNIDCTYAEPDELAHDLCERGYAVRPDKYSIPDVIRITVKGAGYIERKNKLKQVRKYNDEISVKIDLVLSQLTKLGYGQEIVFNEINELKSLHTKLSKKSWSQLLKGKLIDLALDKALSIEIAKSVYEQLTDAGMKLIK